MKSKKLIRNVPAILSVVMMTAVMVLSGCANASEGTGDHASVTIRLSGSGSGRAISDAEKSAATFNVYFNDRLVASNVSGTYTGMAEVGTRLKIRLDALVNGKRIARGEDTIMVGAGSNSVAIKVTENREETPELKGVPVVGSIIMKDGTLRTAADIGNDTANAIAVVYKVAGGKAWAVGKVHDKDNNLAWCTQDANGFDCSLTTNVSGNAGALTFSGYQDGSTGWQRLKTALGANDDTDPPGKYPAWEWANSYANSQGLTGDFASGWYLPSAAELFEIWQQKNTVDSSLTTIRGNTFGDSYYLSSSENADDTGIAIHIGFDDGSEGGGDKDSGNPVCAVRQFTY